MACLEKHRKTIDNEFLLIKLEKDSAGFMAVITVKFDRQIFIEKSKIYDDNTSQQADEHFDSVGRRFSAD